MICGVYQLLIKISENISIKVGAIGNLDFNKGFYVYTGSALNNVYKRVERHLSEDKKLHWHIDYLLKSPHAEVVDIKIIETQERLECKLNQELLQTTGSEIPHKKFGSSDCSSCESHLLKLKYKRDYF